MVLGSGSRLYADLLAQAVEDGGQVTRVRRGEHFAKLPDGSFTVAPGDAAQMAQLLAALGEHHALPDHILHLWTLDTLPGLAGHGLAGQTLAFDSLVALAQAIQALDLTQPMRLTVVSAGSVSVMHEAVPHPERALAQGPCRVMAHELPNVSARVIDFAPADITGRVAAQAILREAQHVGATALVALRGGERHELSLVAAPPVPSPATRQRLKAGGAYLITGGLGDLALELAAWLARTCQARLILVSRRTLPPRESWPALAASGDPSPDVWLVRRLLALEESGAQVAVMSADVADHKAMARVVSDSRTRFGVINGVFHTAGALDDAPMATKTADSVQRVLHPKASGAQVLHELLPPGDLDFFAVFSSTSVYLGTAGQADDVAANAFLDALAASRADGLSVHWGIWADKGMAARAGGHPGIAHEAPVDMRPQLEARAGSGGSAAFEATCATLAQAMLACGIRGEDAPALFERIFSGHERDIVISSMDLDAVGQMMTALATPPHTGLETASAFDALRKASNVIPLVARPWSPLVAICRGRFDRKPLFCVHGGGGNVLNFKLISDRLGPDQPFYGLQAQGVDGRLQPLARIEDMATQYVEAIRAVDAKGPYRLAGYSTGGVIALEMAQQLQAAGAAVAFLGMIGTLSPAAARVPLLKKLWLMRHGSLKYILQWPERRAHDRKVDASYALALERLAQGEPLPPDLLEFHLLRAVTTAQARYHPRPYAGPMTLFSATRADPLHQGAGDKLGWEHHVAGEIRIAPIAGSLSDMMTEPGLSQLIEALRRALQDVDGRPRTRAA